jgi:hypothetical protein
MRRLSVKGEYVFIDDIKTGVSPVWLWRQGMPTRAADGPDCGVDHLCA